LDQFRIPVEHHRALALYYEKVLECSFSLNGAMCEHTEVFHRSGFLPLVVEYANRLSVKSFNQSIGAEMVDAPNSLLGKAVVLPDDFRQPVVFLLMRAAEILFKPVQGAVIELYPMFEYFRLPEEKRSRAAWQPDAV